MITIELSKTRIEELELMFQKEINEYKNKIICKRKFVYLIKEKCNISEFCYLYQTYIGEIESVRRIPEINLEYDESIETIDATNVEYNRKKSSKKYTKRNTKKLVRIEKMAQKKIYYKQYK